MFVFNKEKSPSLLDSMVRIQNIQESSGEDASATVLFKKKSMEYDFAKVAFATGEAAQELRNVEHNDLAFISFHYAGKGINIVECRKIGKVHG